jgi:predicted component of type VI protein secretion system
MTEEGGVRLRVDSGGTSRRIELTAFPVLIGRAPESPVFVDDEQVSRRHAEIDRDDQGRLQIRDVGSSNGTNVDGRRITEPTRITPKSVIRIGAATIRIEEGAAASPVASDLRWMGVPVAAGIAIAAVIVIAVIAIASGAIGNRSANDGIAQATASPTIAPALSSASPEPVASDTSSPEDSAEPTSSDAATPNPDSSTELKFEVTIAGSGVGTKSTITPGVCTRDAGPTSLRVEYRSETPTTQTFVLAIPDTSAQPPVASAADVSLSFTGMARPLVATASDITSLAVDDQGANATITIALTNSQGDGLSGTITCAGIAGGVDTPP